MLLLAATATADELSRSDKLGVAYSNQFAFDRRGVPIITVAIAEGEREVTIHSDLPVRLLPDGEEGAQVTAGRRWHVQIAKGTAAQVEHFAILSRRPAAQVETVRTEAELWQQRGFQPRLLEVGTVFGVKGQVFDNRAFLVLAGPYATREEAQGVVDAEQQKYLIPVAATVAQLRARPSGSFVVRDLDGTARVQARDILWFAPADGKRLTVTIGPASKGGAAVTSSSRSYWGQVYVAVDRDGKMAVVNAVPADRLLDGLVPAEIFPQAPEAALQAQAVAARGELLAKIGHRHLEDPFLLCAKQHCQVYAGAGHEQPRTSAAVKATRGQLLLRGDGGLVDTVYSASCGGHTEDNDRAWPVPADEVLRGKPDAPTDSKTARRFPKGIPGAQIASWLDGGKDTWCGGSPYNKDRFRWTVTLTAARLSELLAGLKLGPLAEFSVVERGVSGRATAIKLRGSLGSTVVKGEYRIRTLLGGLRSSMFDVKAVRGSDGRLAELVLRGGGWGHGVGMCQTGAIGMALSGKTYLDILQFYYPGSRLRTLY